MAFLGVTFSLLVVIGLVAAVAEPSTRPWAISLGVIALLGAVWALGPRTFVFRVAYDVVPGFDLARGSARWIVMVVGVLPLSECHK